MQILLGVPLEVGHTHTHPSWSASAAEAQVAGDGTVMSYSSVVTQPRWICKRCQTENPGVCESCGSCTMPKI